MNIIHDVYFNLWLSISINSFIVFFDSYIRSKSSYNIKSNAHKKEIFSSLYFGLFNFVLDFLILSYFWKEFYYKYILLYFIISIAIKIFHKKKYILWPIKANHVIFDLITLLKPFLMYSTILYW